MYVFALVVSKFMRQVYVLRIAKQITFTAIKSSKYIKRKMQKIAQNLLQNSNMIFSKEFLS